MQYFHNSNTSESWFLRVIVFKDASVTTCPPRCNRPTIFDFWNLLSLYGPSNFLCSSSNTPKNFIEELLSILRFSIFKSESFNSMSPLEELLWNKAYLTFLIFKKSLLALNHFFQFYIYVEEKVFISWCEYFWALFSCFKERFIIIIPPFIYWGYIFLIFIEQSLFSF